MKQIKKSQFKNVVYDYISYGKSEGSLHLTTDNQVYNGRLLRIDNKDVINYGSCSYLGLELDKRLIKSASYYMMKYGVQFASSRAYMSIEPQKYYIDLLESIFGSPVLTFTSVSLGHHAVIPVLVNSGELLILDQQVHASVQDATRKMASNGATIDLVRHNRIDLLEAKIKKLQNQYDKIWYFFDGVYSMYGDFAPLDEIINLANRYPKLHLYVDDAHGMSIRGKNGSGVVLDQIKCIHPRMVIATSLCKAFGTGGSAFIFPSREICEIVKNCSGPYIFSGPIQVPVLGAGIASAKIHLSPEIYEKQQTLQDKLDYCLKLLKNENLPVMSNDHSPIFFVGTGQVKTSLELSRRLIESGCYVNSAIFPAVPDQSAGIRFTLTLHHTTEDIEFLVKMLAYHYPKTFQDLGRSVKDVERGFKKVQKFEQIIKGVPLEIRDCEDFTIQHETTIENIPKEVWNKFRPANSANDWDQLLFFEKTFCNHAQSEYNWKFHYYLVKDKLGQFVLTTFFTETITKDDMFASENVSKQLEEIRSLNQDKYSFSSKNLMMGCLLSLGEHTFIDRTHGKWQRALSVLIEYIQSYRDRHEINVLTFRDFPSDDDELKKIFFDHGFRKFDLPDGHILHFADWNNSQGFQNHLSMTSRNSKQRWHRKRFFSEHVQKFQGHFFARVIEESSEQIVGELYDLYKNVYNNKYEVSVYDLPKKFFKEAIESQHWEVIAVYRNNSLFSDNDKQPVAMTISSVNDHLYNALILGLNYNYRSQNLYAQVLWLVVQRANSLKLPIDLGITSSTIKRKFAAIRQKNSCYIQNADMHKESLMSFLSINSNVSKKEKVI